MLPLISPLSRPKFTEDEFYDLGHGSRLLRAGRWLMRGWSALWQ